MKRVAPLLFILAVMTANAQPPPAEGGLTSELTAQLGKAGSRPSQAAKPNETVKGPITYSGIAVQLLKTDNALQLINPAAPSRYGSPEDNVMRDPLSGKVSGWKLFSIRF